MIALNPSIGDDSQTDIKVSRATFTLPDHLLRYIQEGAEALHMTPSKFLSTIVEWAESEGIVEDVLEQCEYTVPFPSKRNRSKLS